MSERPKKVLVIGSGPIVIGQAAEFDYAGTQACRALREEGIETVLVNSNPATIMTDVGIADTTYIEPLDVAVVTRIIERERPDGLLPTLGGQTGLNLAVDLAKADVLEQFGVRLLGTPLEAIEKAEDRQLFKETLAAIGEPTPPSSIATTVEQALAFGEQIGYPLVVRPAYTLGGTGGGIAGTPRALRELASRGLAASPLTQVLVEQSLVGWKEIEYEVMRDGGGTCITICNMENFDPMGVHTGDSIVVAPSQTLSDPEYQGLRSAALRIISALGIEGGCNVQFALDPHSREYFVIEVNPRVSRSSALASKATGYPIARVAAKIAIGKRLHEIPNAVTRRTSAAFEPALDYLVVKIPRWPFDKFASGDRTLGTQMKATGEVMAIDRCFEAAFQKAVRSLEFRGRSLQWEDKGWSEGTPGEAVTRLRSLIATPNDLRVWALMAALRRGVSSQELSDWSGIDRFFLDKLANIVAVERRLLSERLTPRLARTAKRLGFGDGQIANLSDMLPEQVRAQRQAWGLKPAYKMVDTCAAEFEAVTAYFYGTYESENEALPIEQPRAIVLGSGPIRIGQGIEFDYCSVRAAAALQDAGQASIMINSNPETVSTDFDASTRLYFEPLDEESVRDIVENETHLGNDLETPDAPRTIVQLGGQTAINLTDALVSAGCPILGSGREVIEGAENRRVFEDLLDVLGVPQPPGAAVTSVEEALNTAQAIGYPVVVRPSYVLGGWAMEVVRTASDLVRYVTAASEISSRHPILIDRYLEGREVEVDAVCDGEDVLIPGIMEHIERAGVHSGDSLAVFPTRSLSLYEIETVVDYTQRLGRGLGVRGLFNVQYVIFQGKVYVLEANPRSSRTVPFISKVTGVPMVDIAVQVMLGRSLAAQGYQPGLCASPGLVAVKAPVFSMSKLPEVDIKLGPEMKSTGEVMGVDWSYERALAKALLASGMSMRPKSRVLLSISDRDKAEAIPLIRRLAGLGCSLAATEGTAELVRALGLPVDRVTKFFDRDSPNVLDLLRTGTVGAVVNTLTGDPEAPLRDGFELRRTAAERRIPCYTSLDTARVAIEAMALGSAPLEPRSMREYLGPLHQGLIGKAGVA
ncbi:MAG: carbamoyl-phosphate synthase large subunit [Chloroflexi bacterium]|nr:carbamoyl-phosphate synthase large subunit [Chloroflexota bacterium]